MRVPCRLGLMICWPVCCEGTGTSCNAQGWKNWGEHSNDHYSLRRTGRDTEKSESDSSVSVTRLSCDAAQPLRGMSRAATTSTRKIRKNAGIGAEILRAHTPLLTTAIPMRETDKRFPYFTVATTYLQCITSESDECPRTAHKQNSFTYDDSCDFSCATIIILLLFYYYSISTSYFTPSCTTSRIALFTTTLRLPVLLFLGSPTTLAHRYPTRCPSTAHTKCILETNREREIGSRGAVVMAVECERFCVWILCCCGACFGGACACCVGTHMCGACARCFLRIFCARTRMFGGFAQLWAAATVDA